MIDKVKNTWFVKKGVIVIDVETNWIDDWTEQGKRNREFKCGVAFNYDSSKFYKFTNPKKFVNFIKKAKAIVSYNGEGFDFLVLEKFGLKIRKHKNRWKLQGIKSFDILHAINERRAKKNQNKNNKVIFK